MTTDLLATFDTPEAARALLRDVVRSPQRAVACACSDVTALMREVVDFPQEGVPAADERPALTQRAGEFMAAPGRLLMRSVDKPVAVDVLVGQLLDAATSVPLTDVLVLADVTTGWGDAERGRTLELAIARGVHVHVGV